MDTWICWRHLVWKVEHLFCLSHFSSRNSSFKLSQFYILPRILFITLKCSKVPTSSPSKLYQSNYGSWRILYLVFLKFVSTCFPVTMCTTYIIHSFVPFLIRHIQKSFGSSVSFCLRHFCFVILYIFFWYVASISILTATAYKSILGFYNAIKI